MAFSVIDKSSSYFSTKLYTGNNTGQSITGVGFKPDLIWNKGRNNAEHNNIWDIVRGVGKGLVPSSNGGESAWSTGVTSFDSDGWTMGSLDSMNDGSKTYASWNWKASGTTGSANTDGDIASTVSVNTTAGFSIVKYTGTLTSATNTTVGHGLGVAPKMIIIKSTSNSENWGVQHTGLTANYMLQLNTTAAQFDTSGQGTLTSPTSSVFTINYKGEWGNNGQDYMAYCWADVPGFSKMGSYIGNASTNGTFSYTGFRPAFVMVKNCGGANAWELRDTKRPGYNLSTGTLYPNSSDAENTGEGIDIFSNGFKCRASGNGQNGANRYIYAAFGQPIVSNSGQPNTAF